MKTLGEIDDEYNDSFEDVLEKFKKKLSESLDHTKANKNFNKDLSKIIKKRNSLHARYLRENRDSILGMPEKKKKKAIESKRYRAYNFNFNETFWETVTRHSKKFKFNFLLAYRSVKYNIIPSRLKFLYFKIKLWFHSAFFDINNFLGFTKTNLIKFFTRLFSSIKDIILRFAEFLVDVFKKIISIFPKKKDSSIEEKKIDEAKQKEILAASEK